MTSNPIEVIVVRGTRPNSPPYQVATFFPTFYETTYAFDRVDDSIGEVCENQRLYALINGTTFNSLEAQDPGVATALQNFRGCPRCLRHLGLRDAAKAFKAHT